MEKKHTPGPWVFNTAGSAKRGEKFHMTEIYVYAPGTQDDTGICGDVIDPVTQEPSEANAMLISAAPELLESLEWFIKELGNVEFKDEFKGENEFWKNGKDKARLAVIKAKGVAMKRNQEALRLSAWLTEGAFCKMSLGDVELAGIELRRLHKSNNDLLHALKDIVTEYAPTYHDCVDDGDSECGWCLARAEIAKAENGT